MKQIFTLVVLFFTALQVSQAQCTPDAAGCPDVGNPGEICPAILPSGVQGEPYSQTITILPPASATVGGLPVTLFQVELLSVTNLPAGLSYESNQASNIFLSNNYYCVLLSGTPLDTGTFPLKITVMPYLNVFGVPVSTFTEVVDSTSVTMQILPQGNGIGKPSAGYCWSNGGCFTPNLPGGFFSSRPGKFVLSVHTSMGRLVFSKEMECQPGENHLPSELAAFQRGVYFVSLSGPEGRLTTSWIKPE